MANESRTHKAIWFSRHQPSREQMAAIAKDNCEIVDLEHGLRLGAVDLVTDGDVFAIMDEIRAMVAQTGAELIVGVFPAPIQHRLLINTLAITGNEERFKAVPCFSSWNVSRPVEGQKPTFEHKMFCLVGRLIIMES